ncbi:MAG TPA: hypothetical protein VGK67_39285 [Myxococcales bacterium]|jgi:hypothetical protein
MMRRSLPLLALLCLSLAAPSVALAADSKADAKKKGKKAPEKKAEAEPEPEDAAASQPAAEPKAETRQIEAAPADLSGPEEAKKAEPVAPPPPPAPSRTVGHAGAYLTLSGGYNWWSLNRGKVAGQVAQANPAEDTNWMFDASLQNGAAAGLRGGYDILGHAHIGFNFTGTGWDVFTKERGGGGYIGGEVGWHPLSMIFALVPDHVREKSGQKYYDLFVEGGAGFGLVGKHRAMQGLVGSVGLGTEGYPAQWVSIGVRATWYFPAFNEYIIDYDNRASPGMTIPLPEGSGGRFFSCTGYLAFHFGTPEK